MTGDVFAPAFRVTLDGSPLGPELARTVVSVSVTSELDTSDSFQLTLANQYPELPWTRGAWAGVVRPGQSVVIELGYVERLRTVFRGEAAGFRVSFGAGVPTVVVEGSSYAQWLRREAKTRTFRNVTDRQVVEQIAREAGLTPRVRFGDALHPILLQYNMTDWAFLQERARAIRAEVLLEGRELLFRAPADRDPQTFVLEYGKTLSSFDGGFDPSQQPGLVLVRGYDPKQKKEIVGRVGTSAGGRSAEGRDTVQVRSPVASQEEADLLARAIHERMARDSLTARASCVGRAEARAGVVVELAGIGRSFDGRYYAVRVTHDFDAGGYRTNLDLKRALPG